MGNYILSGRPQAIVSTTFSAILSLLMPPFAYVISGSVVALITLRKGAAPGFQILSVSLILLVLFSYLVDLSLQMSLAYAVVIWLPVWAVSAVLRETERQGALLLAIGLIVALVIMVIYLTVGDVSAWWQQWLDAMLENITDSRIEQYRAALEPAVPMLNAMMMFGLALNILMAVLLGRWWQSRLFNPGAFQQEFYALRLPVTILVISAVVMGLFYVLGEPWRYMFRDILIVIMFIYLIQGISLVHRNVAGYKLSVFWLVLMYCALVLWPAAALFIACLGMVDVYLQWRREKKAVSGDES